MTESPSVKTGSCLCGAVRFEINGGLKQVVGCHCAMCRKQTGHFLATATAWLDEFTFTDETGLQWYRSSDHSRRGFCNKCGSVLFFATDGDGRISITAGSLDAPTGLSMAAHIFVANKGDYYTIDDGLEQYSQGGDKVPMPPRRAE